jgi:UDP-GlcNAc:undecaprenyl-phosphate/decaprenyl-phosphate GlcNAc-1-phosphate transferase
MIKYIIIATASAVCAFALTPLVRRFAIWAGAIDVPGERRIHIVPTPRFGGLAVFGAMLFGLTLAWLSEPSIRNIAGTHAWQLLTLGITSSWVLLVGTIDDRRSVGTISKLFVEVAASLLVIMAGYRIKSVFGIEIEWFGVAATILWIVGVTNAVNMVDGLDGLAAGIGLIISASLLSISLFLGSFTTSLILTALCGALLGFLYHNFFPARIFLGDSGSLLIGFLLAVTAIDSSSKSATVAAIIFPLLCLGLPLSEVVFTTLRRALRSVRVVRLDTQNQRYEFSLFGRPALFTADRDHIHHRLLSMGINHRNVVVLLYFVCAALGASAFLVVAYRLTSVSLLLIAFGVAAMASSSLGYRELQPLNNGLFLPLFDLPVMNRGIVYPLCDLAFIAVSFLAALVIRADGELSRTNAMAFLTYLPLVATVQIGCFMVTGLYRRSYRYAGVADLIVVGKALVVATICGWVALTAARHFNRPAISFTVLDAYLLATLVVGSRLSFRLLDHVFNANREGAQRVVIYGAGKGGVAALQEMRFNPETGMQPIAFLDDDVTKWGQIIQGIPIHSAMVMSKFIDERKIDTVVISTQKIHPERLNKIKQQCETAGITLRVLNIGMEEISPEHMLSPLGTRFERTVVATKRASNEV